MSDRFIDVEFNVELYRVPRQARDGYSLAMRINGGHEVLFTWDRSKLQAYLNGIGHGMFVATGKYGIIKLRPSHEVAFWLAGNELH